MPELVGKLLMMFMAKIGDDGRMTADWVWLLYDLMQRLSARISNEVRVTNRVCFDISGKPPSETKWERFWRT